MAQLRSFFLTHLLKLDSYNSLTSSINHDFSTAINQAYGNAQQTISSGKALMFAADMSPNGVIKNADFNLWKSQPALNKVYDLRDADLDGEVQTTDFNLWKFHLAINGVFEVRY